MRDKSKRRRVSPFRRRQYSGAWKKRLIDRMIALIRSDSRNCDDEQKISRAARNAAHEFGIPEKNARRWFANKDKILGRSNATRRLLHVARRRCKWPDAEAKLFLCWWMRDERAHNRRVDGRRIRSHMRSFICDVYGDESARKANLSNNWLRAAMKRGQFSWRRSTRRSSKSLAARLPAMRSSLVSLAQRSSRQQAKAIRRIAAARQQSTTMPSDEQTPSPSDVIGAAEQPVTTVSLKTDGEPESASDALFNDLDVMRNVVNGDRLTRFGFPPFYRWNFDEIAWALDGQGDYTFHTKGATNVTIANRHGAHKQSRDATIVMMINDSGHEVLQPRLTILYKGTGANVSLNELQRHELYADRVKVMWHPTAYMDDDQCIKWASEVLPEVEQQFRATMHMSAEQEHFYSHLLEVDNLSGHVTDEFGDVAFQNGFKIHALPAGTTDKRQPIDNSLGNASTVCKMLWKFFYFVQNDPSRNEFIRKI